MQDREAMGKSLDLYGDEIVVITRQKQLSDYVSFVKNSDNQDLLYLIGKDELGVLDNCRDGRSDEEYRDEMLGHISYYVDQNYGGLRVPLVIKCGSCGECDECEEDAMFQQWVDHVLILQSRNSSWEDDYLWMDKNCVLFKSLQSLHPRIKICN